MTSARTIAECRQSDSTVANPAATFWEVQPQASVSHSKYARRLQVANCTGSVVPIQAQSVSMAAAATAHLVFDVFVTSAAAIANNTCTVTLYNSQVIHRMARQGNTVGQQVCVHCTCRVWCSFGQFPAFVTVASISCSQRTMTFFAVSRMAVTPVQIQILNRVCHLPQNAVADRRTVSFYTNATEYQDQPSNPATVASVRIDLSVFHDRSSTSAAVDATGIG